MGYNRPGLINTRGWLPCSVSQNGALFNWLWVASTAGAARMARHPLAAVAGPALAAGRLSGSGLERLVAWAVAISGSARSGASGSGSWFWGAGAGLCGLPPGGTVGRGDPGSRWQLHGHPVRALHLACAGRPSLSGAGADARFAGAGGTWAPAQRTPHPRWADTFRGPGPTGDLVSDTPAGHQSAGTVLAGWGLGQSAELAHRGALDPRVAGAHRDGLCHVSLVGGAARLSLPAGARRAGQPAPSPPGDGAEWLDRVASGVGAALSGDGREHPATGRVVGGRVADPGEHLGEMGDGHGADGRGADRGGGLASAGRRGGPAAAAAPALAVAAAGGTGGLRTVGRGDRWCGALHLLWFDPGGAQE